MVSLYINQPHNHVLVIGCFHGDEPQGQYLTEEYIKENPHTKLMFIPCLNEYGVRNKTRTNEIKSKFSGSKLDIVGTQ